MAATSDFQQTNLNVASSNLKMQQNSSKQDFDDNSYISKDQGILIDIISACFVVLTLIILLKYVNFQKLQIK